MIYMEEHSILCKEFDRSLLISKKKTNTIKMSKEEVLVLFNRKSLYI